MESDHIVLNYFTPKSGPVTKWIVTTTFQILSHSLMLPEKAHTNILENSLFFISCTLVPHMHNPDVLVEDFFLENYSYNKLLSIGL